MAMLDGKKTVSEVWRICNEQLGDGAPTQGEVIQLLGQLYTANLLYADLSPDSEVLFNRYRRRIKRQVQGYLMNLLFIRIPLIDPDHFLERWVSIFGRVFSWFGLIFWSVLIAIGLYFVISNFSELIHQSSDVLAPDNLIFLYISFVVIKIFHEFSHAFACKKFGLLNGNGGQVHKMGVMFLVFFPLPYMDASSAWAFRNKWHRAIVGMSGVMAELSAAAIAAIIWANTSTGTPHIIAYNIIFVASVSTLLFNGNPLLRFDAYYVLSDILEIPNLGLRSKNYFYYLVKRYCWGLRKARSQAYTLGERIWFIVYGIASTGYRIFICIRILLFMNNRLPEQLFIIVPFLATAAIIAWVFVPFGKFLHYLFAGAELTRNRFRAVASTLGTFCLVIVIIGLIRLPDHWRVEGVVEPVKLAIVHTETDGFVVDFLPSDTEVSPDGPPLIKAANPKLEAEKKILVAERRGLQVKRRIAELHEIAAAQILDEQIEALDEKIARLEHQISKLNLDTPISGQWVAPDIEHSKGMHLRWGEKVGYVASLNEVLIRATAGQNVAAMLIEQADKKVEMRVKGRPEAFLTGEIEQIFPAGQELLPSVALGYAGGGAMPTQTEDQLGTRAAEKFFEIRIKPNSDSSVRLLTGQRVVVRIRMSSKPLVIQWWQSARQLFQRRFRI